MATLLQPQDIMFTAFEPKLKNRYFMELDGIAAYVVKTAKRPALESETIELEHMNTTRYVKGKTRWQPLDITLYDPIDPSAAQQVMEWIRLSHESVTGRDGYSDFYKKDVVINVLGPVGDKVEEWTGKGAFITEADFGATELDWAGGTDPVDIALTIQCDYWILQF